MFEIVLSLHPLASLNNRLSCLSLSRETCWLSSPSSPRRFFFFLRFLFRPRPCLLFAFLRRLCAGPSYSLFFIQALVCLPFYLIIQFFFFFSTAVLEFFSSATLLYFHLRVALYSLEIISCSTSFRYSLLTPAKTTPASLSLPIDHAGFYRPYYFLPRLSTSPEAQTSFSYTLFLFAFPQHTR